MNETGLVTDICYPNSLDVIRMTSNDTGLVTDRRYPNHLT